MKKIFKVLRNLFIILLICDCVSGVVVSYGRALKNVDDYKIYVIKKGDSLWRIAKQELPNKDTRKVVYNIKKLNDIGSVIYPGQTIKLPSH